MKYLAFNMIASVTYFFPVVSSSLTNFFLLSASNGPTPPLKSKVAKHPVWSLDHILFHGVFCAKRKWGSKFSWNLGRMNLSLALCWMLQYNSFVPFLLFLEKFEFPNNDSIGKHTVLLLKRNPNRDSSVATVFCCDCFHHYSSSLWEITFSSFSAHTCALSLSLSLLVLLSDTHTLLTFREKTGKPESFEE